MRIRSGAYTVLLGMVLLLGAIAPAGAAEAFGKMSLADMKALVAQSKGKVVVINFFATWCPPCREEIPGLMAIRKDIPENKLVLIGLSIDENPSDLVKFADKTKFNYPIKFAGQDLVKAVGLSAIPHMVIYDKEGKLLVSQAGLVQEDALRDFLKKAME